MVRWLGLLCAPVLLVSGATRTVCFTRNALPRAGWDAAATLWWLLVLAHSVADVVGDHPSPMLAVWQSTYSITVRFGRYLAF